MKTILGLNLFSSKSLRRTGSIILAAAFALFVMAVFVGTASAQSSKVETVTFGTTIGGSVGFLTDVIKAYRLDEKNGLNLDLKPFHPGKVAPATLYKTVEAGTFPVISAVRANNQGNRIRLFYGLLWANDGLLVPVNSPYKSLEELKGKRIGIMSRVTGQYTSMVVVTKLLGMDLEADFNLLIGAPPALVAFMKKGDVDAIMHFDPTSTKLIVAKEARELALVNDLWKKFTGGDMLLVGMAAYEDWLKARPQTAKKLIKTMAEGINYIKTKPGIFDEVRGALGIESDEMAKMLKNRQPQYYPDRWDKEVIKNAKLMLQKNVDLGFLDKLPEEEIFVIME